MLPISESNGYRIDIELSPPCAFVTLAMKLTMMQATQRDGELVRNPAAECSRLRIANMVSLEGLAPQTVQG
jgi:hypothetical protein